MARGRSARARAGAALGIAALSLGLVGCGGESPEEAVGETASRLGEIRSGELSMRVLVSPSGEPLDRGAGFLLDGPFALPERGGRLPSADVDYTRVAGRKRATVGIVSTPRAAFVRVDGQAYELPPERERELRSAAGSPEGSSGLERLRIDTWIRDPDLSPGPPVDGAETDRVTSSVDVVRAANALLAAGGETGPGDRPAIAGQDARRLEGAVRSAKLELLTGAEDRLLRRMILDLDLEADAPAALRERLGAVGGARFRLELEVAAPNRRVRVEPPRDALPASALPSAGG